jgi:predicted lipoprotein
MISLAIVLQPAAPVAAETPTFDHAGLARRALERYILPGYTRLADAAKSLSHAMDRYCAEGAGPQRQAVNQAFDAFVAAWGRIGHVRFGPVTTDNRWERILFWPDRRGLGARQVTKALGSRDPSVLDPKALASKSVALQGLGALEIALFGSEADLASDPESRAHRCRFASAVAANLAAITRTLADEWTRPDGYARDWLAPGPGNPAFLNPSETTMALAKSFGQGLERTRDERLGVPLGLTAQKSKTPPVLQASGRTLRLVRAEIDGLFDLYTEGGMLDAILATKIQGQEEHISGNAKVVTNELKTARGVADELVDVRDPFTTDASRRRMIAMGFPLKNARVIAGELLSLTAGLTLGFNASDGD